MISEAVFLTFPFTSGACLQVDKVMKIETSEALYSLGSQFNFEELCWLFGPSGGGVAEKGGPHWRDFAI